MTERVPLQWIAESLTDEQWAALPATVRIVDWLAEARLLLQAVHMELQKEEGRALGVAEDVDSACAAVDRVLGRLSF